MTWTPPAAWKVPEPEWVPLAPGVRWLLQRPDGGQRHAVTTEVAAVMSRIYQGRAEMELAGLDRDPGFASALSLDQLQGAAGVLSGCLFAQACLHGWEGMEAEGGEGLDHTDPDNVKAALLYGPPSLAGEMPLLAPFLAWLEGSRRPMAADAVRLKDLAKDHWSGGPERCRACDDEGDDCAKGGAIEGQICPRLKNTPQTPPGALAWHIAQTIGHWKRAGMAGAVIGLDYGAALIAYETLAKKPDEIDLGAAFLAFRAIEAGRLEAEAEKAPTTEG